MALFEIYIVGELNAKNVFIKRKVKYEDKMKNNFGIQFSQSRKSFTAVWLV